MLEERTDSLKSFARKWIELWALIALKPYTYAEYEGITRVHLVPALGHHRLAELTPEVIQRYVADKVAEGLAPATVRNHVIVLKQILDTACDWAVIEENPARVVTPPRLERSEMRFLTPEQLRLLIASTPPWYRLLLSLPAFCGLRKGEVLALEWSDICLDSMTVSVTKTMRDGVVTTPKTKASIGRVPMPESIRQHVAERQPLERGNKLVFSNADGSPMWKSAPNGILARVLDVAGLPPCRYHDLRHSWAVAHLKAGTDIKTLAALGRWSSPTTLLETYAHVLDPMGGEAVRNLDRLLNEED